MIEPRKKSLLLPSVLLLVILFLPASLPGGSVIFAQSEAVRSGEFDQKMGFSFRNYIVTTDSDSISIRKIRRVDWVTLDSVTFKPAEGLRSIQISAYRGHGFQEPHSVFLQFYLDCIEKCAKESQEIRLEIDGVDIVLDGAERGGIVLGSLNRSTYLHTFELTVSDYRRVAYAKSLTIKLGGECFEVLEEQIQVLRFL